MKMLRFQTSAVRAIAMAAAILWLATASRAQPALPPNTPANPGLPIASNTPGVLSGTVLAVIDSPFVDNAQPTPFAAGMLRSFVVDRDSDVTIALDFVYQLVNTSPPPPDLTKEFFRLKTTGGYDNAGLPISIAVANTNAFSGLQVGPGSGFVAGSYTQGATLKDAASADRDVATIGSIGFTFPRQPPPAFLGDPRNVGQGESSSFLVVRTSQTTFTTVPVAISGAATGFATAFAPFPVPEPGSASIATLGLCAIGLARRRRRAGPGGAAV